MSKKNASQTMNQTPAQTAVVVATGKNSSVAVPSDVYAAMEKLGFSPIAIGKAYETEEKRQAAAALAAFPSIVLATDEAALAVEERKAHREELEGWMLASTRRGVAKARVSLRVARDMRAERVQDELDSLEERAALLAALSPERRTSLESAQASIAGLRNPPKAKDSEAQTVAQSGTIVPASTARAE